ncbi:MAG TPA: hypothetical protein VJZ78_06510 [Anaerolineales bacterium]|nr:hypothetical protein [Anaerolineales bacterium]
MKKFLSNTPFHPILFAIYPIIALFVVNIKEIRFEIIVRSLILSALFALLIILFLRLILKNWYKAAVVTSLFLILFFTYGHLYHYFQQRGFIFLARHRYLSLIFICLFLLFLWVALRKVKNYESLTLSLNSIGLILLIFPLIQIIVFSFSVTRDIKIVQNFLSDGEHVSQPAAEANQFPDVYYIVLDTYTRQDALLKDFNFDNSPFFGELRDMGFYVADCSRSNYSYTEASMVATLNLNYLPALFASLQDRGMSSGEIWVLIKKSIVREELESIGYQTVAFQTDYKWSSFGDADVLLGLGNATANSLVIKPFETMLIRSTALLLLDDTIKKISYQQMDISNHPFADHISLQLFTLDQLSQVPSIPGPKFIFVHILIPHVPYVFNAEGDILTDPGYFSGNNSMAVNEDYLKKGYIGEVEFINSRMLQIFSEILDNSRIPPIIVIHGDHGLRDDNRLEIFNAYYLPQNGKENLYSSISPMNSFRVIFDTYFGTHYGLLPDESYLTDDFSRQSPETSPACMDMIGN